MLGGVDRRMGSLPLLAFLRGVEDAGLCVVDFGVRLFDVFYLGESEKKR